MTRFLYRCLLWLHPPAFRARFGEEMLWIFDQSAEKQTHLLGDGAASLLRQWIFRSGLWKLPLAVCGGLLAPVFGLWILPVADLRVNGFRVRDDSLEGLIVLVVLSAVLIISMTVTLSVFWFRFVRGRRA